MIRLTLISTLFPYPTLFRSGFLSHTGFSHGGNGFEGMQLLLEEFKDRPLRDPGDPGHGLDLAADRKSTRLNSSHANISYAVFCLNNKLIPLTYIVSSHYLH